MRKLPMPIVRWTVRDERDNLIEVQAEVIQAEEVAQLTPPSPELAPSDTETPPPE
jgi:hypothetical protein